MRIILLLILVMTCAGFQTPSVKTDRGVYPLPSPLPTPPAVAGGTTIDPVFGTTIIRVTTEQDWPAPGCGTWYNQWPTFNADNTRLLIRCGVDGDVIFKEFNPATLAVGPTIAINPRLPGGVSVQWQGATWSRTDPDLLYCTPNSFDADYPSSGAKLYSYRFSTKSFTLIKDFGPIIGASDWFFEMHVANDDVFTFGQFRRSEVENPFKYLIYKRTTDTILLHIDSKDPRLFPTNGTNVALPDKSGRWVFFSENGTRTPDQRRIAIEDLQADSWQYIPWNSAGDPPGHGDMGTGVLAGRGPFSGGENKRSLSNVAAITPLFDWKAPAGTGSPDFSEDCHSSLYANDENWMLLSCYDESDVGETHVWENEIMQISMIDGSFRRLAHHNSIIIPGGDLATQGYYAMPKATISQDGRFIAFTSNWGNSGRTDLYLVVVPPVAVSSPTPVPSPAPSPSPTPSPTPPSACTMTVSSPALSEWSLGKIVVTLNGLTQSGTVRVIANSGQVTVSPQSQTVNGTSVITEFAIQTKRKSSSVTVSGPCGTQVVQVTVQ